MITTAGTLGPAAFFNAQVQIIIKSRNASLNTVSGEQVHEERLEDGCAGPGWTLTPAACGSGLLHRSRLVLRSLSFIIQ